MATRNSVRAACAAVLSAVLFYLSFPNVLAKSGYSYFAWIFAVPLFFGLKKTKAAGGALSGVVFGAAAYPLILRWMFPVTPSGAALFAAFMALQPVLFCAFYARAARYGAASVIFVPALWAASEYARSIALCGFTWDLGYSQSFTALLPAAAPLAGSYGISFILIAANYSLFLILDGTRRRAGLAGFAAVLMLTGFLMARGGGAEKDGSLNVAVVQGNVDQKKKWDRAFAEDILSMYSRLTVQAAELSPDVIIWPETALPGDYYAEAWVKKEIENLSNTTGVPLLIGAPVARGGRFFNGALYISGGEAAWEYDKQSLIPLIEYLPESGFFERLSDVMGIKRGIFSPGHGKNVFRMQRSSGKTIPFGMTICSEDMYAAYVRGQVSGGAEFIVNLTNDAFIENTEGAYLHLGGAAMRAAENRRPVVRAANRGLSCIINAEGAVESSVTNGGRQFDVEGAAVFSVRPGKAVTPYAAFGHYFPALCAALAAAACAVRGKRAVL